MSWIYQSEIFPMNQRAYGTALSTASNWLNNVIIGQITPVGCESRVVFLPLFGWLMGGSPFPVQNLGWKYFFVYVATNASNAVVSYFLFPETKHKTLEEIGLLFGDTNVRVYEGQPRTLTFDGEAHDVGSAEKEKMEGRAHMEGGAAA